LGSGHGDQILTDDLSADPDRPKENGRKRTSIILASIQ
jgi:hypothetical protein